MLVAASWAVRIFIVCCCCCACCSHAEGTEGSAALGGSLSWEAFVSACGLFAAAAAAALPNTRLADDAAGCARFNSAAVRWTGVVKDAVDEHGGCVLYLAMAPSVSPAADVVLRAGAELTASSRGLLAPGRCGASAVGSVATFTATLRRRSILGFHHEFEALTEVALDGDRASWRAFLAACAFGRRLLLEGARCDARFEADFRGFSLYWTGVVADGGWYNEVQSGWLTVRMSPRDSWRGHDLVLTWAEPVPGIAGVSPGDTVSFRGTVEALGSRLMGVHTVTLRHIQREAPPRDAPDSLDAEEL